MKRTFLLFLLLLTGLQGASLAQTRCISAVDLETEKVVETLCVGQPVLFKDCSGTLLQEVYYDFDFKETHQNFTDTTSLHTYTKPGIYVVSQYARDNQGIDASVTKTYVVKPLPLTAAQAPVLREVIVTGPASPGTVSFTLDQLQPGYVYILEQAPAGGSAFSPLDTIRPASPGTLTHLVHNLETAATRCYRLRATGFCGGGPDVNSGLVCSLPISVRSGNRQNTVSWSAYAGNGLQRYQVYRDGVLVADLPISATAFPDQNVACGRTYCYRVAALLGENKTSDSLPVYVKATSTTPPKPGYLHTSFTNENQVVVTLQAPADETVQEVTVQRSVRQGGFLELDKTGPSPFIDLSFSDFSAPVCYQATYQDSCGLSSALSNRSCPVVLQLYPVDEGTVRLEWTGYEGFPGGVTQYAVELLDPNGTVYSSVPVSSTTYTDPELIDRFQTLTYRIKAISANSAEVSYSNKVNLNREFKVFVPNAFTPNNDGLNDLFEVKGRFVASFRMMIYNNWGQVVFQSNNQKHSWDGRVNGKEAPVGSYGFTVEAVDSNGKKFMKTGTLTLLR